jgi:hypothetical protein
MTDSKRFKAWCREVGIPIDDDIVSTFNSGRICGAREAWDAALRECEYALLDRHEKQTRAGFKTIARWIKECVDVVRALAKE